MLSHLPGKDFNNNNDLLNNNNQKLQNQRNLNEVRTNNRDQIDPATSFPRELLQSQRGMDNDEVI
jgi:hypothetical protein